MNLSKQTSADRFAAVAYPPGLRWLAAGLFVVSRLAPFGLALMFFLGWVISPPLLVRLILFLVVLPGLALWFLRRVFAVNVHLHDSAVTLDPCGWLAAWRKSLGSARVERWPAWSMPAPGVGARLQLTEPAGTRTLDLEPWRGADWPWSRCLADRPSRTAEASLTYAQAKARSRLARWHWPWFKFGVFGLFPVLVVFRLHQNIMYGGLLGQYHLQGLAPWLSSLAYHWILYTLYLVLFAAFWRGWVELACWLGARLMPARAGAFRGWGEALALAVYFLGIPAFIVWRSVA